MSIQSSINQAVNGMMSMIMPMSLLKGQGKVKQLKAEQEALKTSNDELTASNEDLKTSYKDLKTSYKDLKTSNDELKTSYEELKKRNDEEIKLWDEIIQNAPWAPQDAASDFLSSNPYAVGGQMAGTVANQRVQSAQELRKSQMENLQKAFQNIGMGGVNNG